MGHKDMVDLENSCGLDGSLEWLCEYIETGVMPTRGIVPESKRTSKNRGWGSVEKVGVGTRTFDVPFIRPENQAIEEFFALPTVLDQLRQEILERERVAEEMRDVRPIVTYSKRRWRHHNAKKVRKEVSETNSSHLYGLLFGRR